MKCKECKFWKGAHKYKYSNIEKEFGMCKEFNQLIEEGLISIELESRILAEIKGYVWIDENIETREDFFCPRFQKNEQDISQK